MCKHHISSTFHSHLSFSYLFQWHPLSVATRSGLCPLEPSCRCLPLVPWHLLFPLESSRGFPSIDLWLNNHQIHQQQQFLYTRCAKFRAFVKSCPRRAPCSHVTWGDFGSPQKEVTEKLSLSLILLLKICFWFLLSCEHQVEGLTLGTTQCMSITKILKTTFGKKKIQC